MVYLIVSDCRNEKTHAVYSLEVKIRCPFEETENCGQTVERYNWLPNIKIKIFHFLLAIDEQIHFLISVYSF